MSRYFICIDAYEPEVFTGLLVKVGAISGVIIMDRVRVIDDPAKFARILKGWAEEYDIKNLKAGLLYHLVDKENLQKVFRLL